MILRPYQTRSIAFLQDKTRGFVKAPAGSGKTIIGANAVAKKIKPGQRCSWLANTHEQVEQATKALSSTEGPQGVEFDIRCAAGSPDVSDADILVIDECFPAGTLVDGRPIESLAPGDLITAFDPDTGELSKVPVLRRIVNERKTRLLRISLSDGSSVVLTEDHPIFSPSAHCFIPARLVKSNYVVYVLTPHESRLHKNLLQRVQKSDSGDLVLGKQGETRIISYEGAGVLLKDVQQGVYASNLVRDDEEDQLQTCVGAHENPQSDAALSGQNPDEGDAKGYGLEAARSRGERSRPDGAAETVGWALAVADGGCHTYGATQRFWLPDMLQSRRGERAPADGGRGGRYVSWFAGPSCAGSEERPVLGFARVESVEVFEPRSAGNPGCGGGQDLVYNLEVGGPHTFFANGMLVHNCHHLMAPTWLASASAACGIVWGLSATPWGTDPERNAALVEFFGGMENFIEIPREEVMAGGSLAKGLVFMYDLDIQGQFDEEIAAKVAVEVARRCKRFWNIPKFEHERRATWQITQETVQQNRVRNAHACHTIRTAVAAGKSVLTLVGSIVHGEEIAQQVEGSVVVFSKMGAKKRREAIGAFREGSLKSMVCTSLADEGLDCPIASELVLLAGGRSAAKIEQRSGRVMRPHEGKEFGIVHDYLDRGAKFAFAQAIARQKTYTNLGYEIQRVKNI